MTTKTIEPASKCSIFEELRKLAEPHISDYSDDLLILDKAAIEECPNRKFLHWTRESGTWLTWLWDTEDLPAKGKKVPYLFGKADRERISKGVIEIAEACLNDNIREGKSYHKLVIHYDGKRLRKIDCEKAVLIAKQNHRRLLEEWKH